MNQNKRRYWYAALWTITGMVMSFTVALSTVVAIVEVRRPHQPYPITITQKVTVSAENQTGQTTKLAFIAETEHSLTRIQVDSPDFFSRVSVGQTVWVKPRMDSVWAWVSPGVRSTSVSRWINTDGLIR